MRVIILRREFITKHYETERERLRELSNNSFKAIEQSYIKEGAALVLFDRKGAIEVDQIGQQWILRG